MPLNLTDEQLAIVAHNHGPALVFAVAGAGKTTALVHRLERLVRERIFDPRKLLATSFSKMAVDDLKTSLQRWGHTSGVQVSTLHALGYRIVRKAASEGLIKLKEEREGNLEYGLLQRSFKRARDLKVSWADELDTLDSEDFLSYIGAAKGNLQYADLKAANLPVISIASQATAPKDLEWYLGLYKIFEQVRREEGSLSFDDMLMSGWELLIQHSELLQLTQSAFQAVLVDEFQDVNLAQSELLELITAPHRNYMAVGDDDQTIYEWRGASPRFILEFERRYQAQKFLIRDTFRCPAPQVVLAGKIIAHNQNREAKNLSLTKGFEGKVHLRLEPHTPAQAQSLVSDIAGALQEGHKLSDLVVLVRLYAQTPYLEQTLIERQIPYRVVGSAPFYARPEIQVLLSYLELGLTLIPTLLPRGEGLLSDKTPSPSGNSALHQRGAGVRGFSNDFRTHWLRIYNTPKRYLPRAVADAVFSQAQRQGSLLTALKQAKDNAEERVAKRLQELVDLFEWLAGVIERSPAHAVLEALESRLEFRKHLIRSSGFYEVGAGKAEGVKAFLEYVRDKGTVSELLAHIAELSQEHLEDEGGERLQIMTIFRAKGLEWPLVFIPDCNEGTQPYSGSESIEEERRLFYVALTRSSRHTYLYALESLPLSPFLKEGEYLQTLSAVEKVGEALRLSAESLTTAQTLALAQGIAKLGLERYLHNWWNSVEAQAVAAKVLRLFNYAEGQSWLEVLGLTPQAKAVWEVFDIEAGGLQQGEFNDLERYIFKAPSAQPATLQIGQKVRHIQFGTGLVVGLESGVATIAFGDGVRKLALKYARLELIN